MSWSTRSRFSSAILMQSRWYQFSHLRFEPSQFPGGSLDALGGDALVASNHCSLHENKQISSASVLEQKEPTHIGIVEALADAV